MDSIVLTSLIVSLIAISVIFTVLIVLIYTIKLLVRLIPYEEPPAQKITSAALPKTSPLSVSPDIISAITCSNGNPSGEISTGIPYYSDQSKVSF